MKKALISISTAILIGIGIFWFQKADALVTFSLKKLNKDPAQPFATGIFDGSNINFATLEFSQPSEITGFFNKSDSVSLSDGFWSLDLEVVEAPPLLLDYTVSFKGSITHIMGPHGEGMGPPANFDLEYSGGYFLLIRPGLKKTCTDVNHLLHKDVYTKCTGTLGLVLATAPPIRNYTASLKIEHCIISQGDRLLSFRNYAPFSDEKGQRMYARRNIRGMAQALLSNKNG